MGNEGWKLNYRQREKEKRKGEAKRRRHTAMGVASVSMGTVDRLCMTSVMLRP